MTSKSTWTGFERDVAKFFGTKRNPLSGASNTDDSGNERPGDVIHPVILNECKLRKRFAFFRIWDKLEEEAKKYKRPPLLWVREKGDRKTVLVCMHGATFAKIYNFLEEHNFDWNNCIMETYDFTEVVK